MSAMDVVDYEIFGDDMQFVQVELDPGEAAVAEAGKMMFMDDGIRMETSRRRGARLRGPAGYRAPVRPAERHPRCRG